MGLAESSRGVSSIRVAACGSVLQRVAVCCNVFAAWGVLSLALTSESDSSICVAACSMCVAMCCSVFAAGVA